MNKLLLAILKLCTTKNLFKYCIWIYSSITAKKLVSGTTAYCCIILNYYFDVCRWMDWCVNQKSPEQLNPTDFSVNFVYFIFLILTKNFYYADYLLTILTVDLLTIITIGNN